MSKTINLPCFGISIAISGDANEDMTSGTVVSDLRDAESTSQYRASIDTLEQFILSAACAGIDVTDSRFLQAIEETVQAVSNHVDSQDEPALYVKKHPRVEARYITWEQAKAIFPHSDRFKDRVEYLHTAYYSESTDDPTQALLDEDTFTDEALWLIGPYPDNGYGLEANQGFQQFYMRIN